MLSRVKSIYGKILLTIMACFVLPVSVVFFAGYHRLENVNDGEVLGELTQSNISQMEEEIRDLERPGQSDLGLSLFGYASQ